MKTKSLLLTVIASLGLAASTMAQSNCNLINSATFSTPSTTQTVLQGSVLRMINGIFNPVDINQWNYIVWVKTSTNGGKIYKNGNLVFSGSFQNTSYSYSRLDLGAEFYTSYGNFYDGLIDEVRISNIERTSNEIQNYYNSNQPFILDANTVGLWHFDENVGTSSTGVIGATSNITNGTWSQGIFGSCINFNGINTRASMNMQIPTSNMTIEFWIKPNSFPATGDYRPISLYGMNTTTFILSPTTITTNYTWSTGATGNSVTVNPSTLPYIWVTDGNCTDTIWFNSQSATIYDTTYVTVTDTLIINTSVTGINPPNNVNTIKVFPNPASTHITINYGNFAIMNGYQLRIENSLGQQVFQTNITQQTDYLSLATWGGNGIYFVRIIDQQGNTIDIRKIVLQ
jgi:hypothetical protein